MCAFSQFEEADRGLVTGLSASPRLTCNQRSANLSEDEQLGAVVVADVVQDVRVSQRRNGLDLALESLAELRISGEPVGKDF